MAKLVLDSDYIEPTYQLVEKFLITDGEKIELVDEFQQTKEEINVNEMLDLFNDRNISEIDSKDLIEFLKSVPYLQKTAA